MKLNKYACKKATTTAFRPFQWHESREINADSGAFRVFPVVLHARFFVEGH
jgi:hypothetical protein